MSYNFGLVGVNNTQDATLSTIILDNFVSFYDWGFLDKGGFNTATIPSSGMYGGDRSTFRLANDPNYVSGRVWQAFRENWVWETGISKATQPVQFSGVYLNNSFIPYTYNSSAGFYTGSAPTGYRVDFNDGRIVFDQPIPSASTVKANYSYKWIKVDKAEGVGFFRQIQNSNFTIDSNFLSGSGEWVQLGQTRVQLPAVFVEVVPNTQFTPFQLGGGQWAKTDVVFYSIANREADCSNLLNIISYQNDRTIKLFDTNKISKSGTYPVGIMGDLINRSYNYPHLVNNYFYGNLRIYDSRINNITQLATDFYIGTARCSTQIELSSVT
jgi:hypothetical protein